MPLIRLQLATKKDGVCRAQNCLAPLTWYATLTGRAMPMNAGATPTAHEHVAILVEGIRTVVEVGVFDASESHWATCPAREAFRQRTRR
jgi:hypothetical protein